MLKNKNLSLLIFGRATSTFGDIFLKIGISLYLLRITGSAAVFGSALAISILPIILISPFSGLIVDRFDRKKMLISLDLIRFLVQTIFIILYFFNYLPFPALICLLVFFALGEVLFEVTIVSVFPSIVSKEKIVAANTADQTVLRLVQVVTPFAAAFVFEGAGLGVIFILNAVTFLGSAVSESFLKLEKAVKSVSQSKLINSIREITSLFKKDIRLSSLVFNGMLTHIFLFPFTMVGVPYLIVTYFKQPGHHYGLVESSATAGAVAALLIVSTIKNKERMSLHIGIGIVGMIMVSFGYMLLWNQSFVDTMGQQSFGIAAYFSVLAFLMSAVLSYYLVFYRSFYQTNVPGDLLGRYTAVSMLLLSTGRMAGFQLFGQLFDSKSLVLPVAVLMGGMLLKLLTHIPFLLAEKKERRVALNPASMGVN